VIFVRPPPKKEEQCMCIMFCFRESKTSVETYGKSKKVKLSLCLMKYHTMKMYLLLN